MIDIQEELDMIRNEFGHSKVVHLVVRLAKERDAYREAWLKSIEGQMGYPGFERHFAEEHVDAEAKQILSGL